MDKEVKIGLILSAYDRASDILDKVFGKTGKNMAELKKAGVEFGAGMAMMGAGFAGMKMLNAPVEAFGKMQEAGNDLKAAMMGPGGVLDENTYKKIATLSMDLSDKYKGSATDYLDMVKVLKQNRINEADVLGGIGDATAKLADLFNMTPAAIAEFSAHMKNDMGVAVDQMNGVMDLVARVHGSGVGKTGSEAVTEMNEFFSKASLGAANLGVQGLEASKQMGALGALFMSRGLSGATVGTNFRRIFDGLRDATRVGKANEVAAAFGKHLNLFDKSGKFLGMDNFVQQLGTLRDLTSSQISAVFKAFGGKQGLSTDFIEYLTKNGLTGYQEFLEKMNAQGDLTDKLNVKMGGLEYQQQVLHTSTQNLMATIGEAFAPTLTSLVETLNKVVGALRVFAAEHPHIIKLAAAFVAASSALLMLGGAIKIITALSTVMQVFGISTTIALGPIGWTIAGIIAGLALLYAYSDKINAAYKNYEIVWPNVFKNMGKFLYNWLIYPLMDLLKIIGGIGKAFHIGWLAKAGDFAANIVGKATMDYSDMTKIKEGSAAYARQGLYTGTGGQSNVNNNVTVNLSGGATAADGKTVSEGIYNTFDKLMREHEQRKARRAY